MEKDEENERLDCEEKERLEEKKEEDKIRNREILNLCNARLHRKD